MIMQVPEKILSRSVSKRVVNFLAGRIWFRMMEEARLPYIFEGVLAALMARLCPSPHIVAVISPHNFWKPRSRRPQILHDNSICVVQSHGGAA